MKTKLLNFLREVDPIEVALAFNAFAWANYFSVPPKGIPNAFYIQMTNTLNASFWSTAGLVILVLQVTAIVSRSHRIRNALLLLNIAAGIFIQVALIGLTVVTIVVPLNAGLLIATVFALLSRTVRHNTVRIG